MNIIPYDYFQPSSPGLDSLSLNTHPFIGSHDSAANAASKHLFTAHLPFVETQTHNFLGQFNFGVRWFDLRVQKTIIGDDITFKHGPILLQDMIDDTSFWNMLNTAVSEQQIVLLDFNHYPYSEKESIMNKFNEYLSNTGLSSNAYRISDPSGFNLSLRSYKDAGMYILYYASRADGEDDREFIQSDYDKTIACFKESIWNPYRCEELSCMGGPAHPNFIGLFNNLIEDYNNNLTLRDNGDLRLSKLSGHFQAPHPKPSASLASVICLPGFSAQAIEQEIAGNVNEQIKRFFEDNIHMIPNIISMDNVNSASLELKNLLENRARPLPPIDYNIPWGQLGGDYNSLMDPAKGYIETPPGYNVYIPHGGYVGDGLGYDGSDSRKSDKENFIYFRYY